MVWLSVKSTRPKINSWRDPSDFLVLHREKELHDFPLWEGAGQGQGWLCDTVWGSCHFGWVRRSSSELCRQCGLSRSDLGLPHGLRQDTACGVQTGCESRDIPNFRRQSLRPGRHQPSECNSQLSYASRAFSKHNKSEAEHAKSLSDEAGPDAARQQR